jgi:hypothetical protein
MTTYMLFVGLISLEETFTYSGYRSLPFGFLLGGAARRAELHVTNGGDGDYGVWGVLDWLFGSRAENNVDGLDDDEDDIFGGEDIDEKITKTIEEYKRRIGEKRGKTRRRANNNARG